MPGNYVIFITYLNKEKECVDGLTEDGLGFQKYAVWSVIGRRMRHWKENFETSTSLSCLIHKDVLRWHFPEDDVITMTLRTVRYNIRTVSAQNNK
jgi:hypothetical protein